MTAEITITVTAWQTIAHEVAAVAGDGLETGGILLGHDTHEALNITVAGDPGPNALRAPARFLRDRAHAQRLAADAWDTNRAQWIGEWHTHPTTPPIPSDVDLEAYTRHLADDELNFTRFISIILGTTPTGEATAATWVITLGTATLMPLQVIQKEGLA